MNPQPFSDGRGGTTYAPVIVLDDGSTLEFEVDETDRGVYGVKVVKTRRGL